MAGALVVLLLPATAAYATPPVGVVPAGGVVVGLGVNGFGGVGSIGVVVDDALGGVFKREAVDLVTLVLPMELLRLASGGLRFNTGVVAGEFIALVPPPPPAAGAVMTEAVEDAENEAITLCGNGSQTRISIMSPTARPLLLPPFVLPLAEAADEFGNKSGCKHNSVPSKVKES